MKLVSYPYSESIHDIDFELNEIANLEPISNNLLLAEWHDKSFEKHFYLSAEQLADLIK